MNVDKWIVDEIMTWRDRSKEIQEEFMRTGLYTHLYISDVSTSRTGEMSMYWCYIFGDMGMHHEIQRTACFSGKKVNVDGVESYPGDANALRHFVFDHYRDFMDELEEEIMGGGPTDGRNGAPNGGVYNELGPPGTEPEE